MLSLLTIVFVVLKLLHVIDWSWFNVVLPFLIEVLITLPFLVADLTPTFHKLVGDALATTMDTVMGRR